MRLPCMPTTYVFTSIKTSGRIPDAQYCEKQILTIVKVITAMIVPIYS